MLSYSEQLTKLISRLVLVLRGANLGKGLEEEAVFPPFVDSVYYVKHIPPEIFCTLAAWCVVVV